MAARARALFRELPWGPLALLFAGWVASATLRPFDNESILDVWLYRDFGREFLNGTLPYRDIAFEYPPFAALVMGAAAIPGTDAGAYERTFAAFTFLLAAGGVLMAGRLARATGGSERWAAWAFAALPFLLGVIVRGFFDLVPVILLLAGVLAVVRERPALGMGLVGAGAMSKGFPLLAAAPLGAWLWSAHGRRAALRGAAGLAVALAAGGAMALALSPSGAVEAVRYQVDRPIQIESTPAAAVYVLDALGGERPAPKRARKSDGLTHPSGDAIAALGVLALVVTLVLLTLAASRAGPDARGAALVALAALATAVALATFGRVHSPQFAIWSAPLMALAAAQRRWVLAAVLAGALGLTLAEFPHNYEALVRFETFPRTIVVLRDLLLVVAVVMTTRFVLRESRPRARPCQASFVSTSI